MPAPTASDADADSSPDPDETLLELKASRAQLDESTEVSDTSTSEAEPNSLPTVESATRQRKTRGVTDGRGRRIRGLLATLGQIMATGNSELGAIKLLQATVVAKPGGLSKQCVKRWHAAFAGPSSAVVDSVFQKVGHEHLDPIISYNDRREQFPVTHANQKAKWLGAKRPRPESSEPPSAPVRPVRATGWGASASFTQVPPTAPSLSAAPTSPCMCSDISISMFPVSVFNTAGFMFYACPCGVQASPRKGTSPTLLAARPAGAR